MFLVKWVNNKLDELSKDIEEQQKSEIKPGVFGRMFNKKTDVNEETEKLKRFQKELLNLQVYLDGKIIPSEFRLS